ncbi:hypothetical protein Lepto7376_1944 [[Leptolyngbya] sp. PCC 7376]|uniref:hypothetical protein n=1 Tax=[Leptolyngbya] sp. PCC 7376 TaxID=111781 RepID=UPI00029EEA0D|nr:hypothetical protein [[Leptolyngbya] sp. PCC 7376]AFY38258.1 hypothetical protein Lepto7376_1944 [[Leptolyngbya] sp. PCC 7376]
MVASNYQKTSSITDTGNSSGFFDRMVGRITGQPVPKSIIQFHHKTYRDLSTKAWHIQRIQLEKFDNREFVKFLRIKRDLTLGHGKYKGLNKAVKLLEVGLAVKDSFLLIEQTEMRFRSSSQQKFYKFIGQLLAKSYDKKKTLKLIRVAFKKISKKIKTNEGHLVMKDYVAALEIVVRHNLGLELLRAFKRSRTRYYTMLSNISKITKTIRKGDLSDLRKIAIIVRQNQADFEQLGKVLSLPSRLNSPNSYARMLQYVALKHRHQSSVRKFNELIKHLIAWESSFLTLSEIRREYTTKQYQPVDDFFSSVPAWTIYRQYQEYLDAYRQECF